MTRFFYSVFGGRLSSSILLPELRRADPGPVRWSFEVTDRLPEPGAMELLGWETLYGSITARLYRHAAGYRITVGDTGSYELLDDGARILWRPNREPWWDFGRGHLIGRVLATSLQLNGTVTLHGSAVEMEDGVVGFLAPKNFGKSTLAMSLYGAGARFVSDDSLPLAVGERITAFPGIHSLRVRQTQGAPHAVWQGQDAGSAGRDGKVTLPPLPEDRVLLEPAPLAALYFLSPQRADTGLDTVTRIPVPPLHAAMGLVGQTKIGAMLGSHFAQQLLDAAAAITAAVPVYQLAVVRDLNRLSRVVDQLVDWHGASVPTPAPGQR